MLLSDLFQLNMCWNSIRSHAFIVYILCFLLFNLDVNLTLEPSSSPLFHGESVTFTCNMTGGYDSNWLYKFHRNGQHIVAKSDVSNSLQLHLVTDLSGRYQCSAYRKDSPGINKQSNNITLSVAANRPTATVTADKKTISEGRQTELTCSVKDSAGWKYDWFMHSFSEAQIENNAVKNTINIHSGGIYWCRGRRGSPAFFTEPSEKFVIEKSLSNQATVALQHSWSQIYSGEAISMRCEIKGGGSSMREYEWRTTTSKPPSRESTVHIRASASATSNFWCRGRADPFSSTEWSQEYHLRVSDKPRPVVRADKRLIPVGGNVTLTCSVDYPTEWKYYWFRHTGNFSDVKTIEEGKSENAISVSQGGVYYCQGGRGNPVFFTEESHRITIEKRVSNMAAVSLEPDLPAIYSGETITVRCEISGSQSNEWVYEWSKPISDTLPMNEYRIVTASESSSGNYRCLGRRKQDLYSSTEWSNVRTVTVSEQRPKAEIIADRNFSTGGTVTLTCSVPPSSSPSSWTYHWYRDEIASKPLELKSAANGELVASQNGLYFCRGGRGSPVYYTESSHSVTVDIPATDRTRPVVTQQSNWPTVYYGEKVTLRCEIQGQPQDWVFEWISSCGAVPSTQNETLCLSYSCNGHYWCRGRRKSDPQDVTWWSAPLQSTYVSFAPKSVLTVSPSWLSPGASVTLSCEVKDSSAGWRFYWYKAVPDLLHVFMILARRRRSLYFSSGYNFEHLPGTIKGTVENSYIIHGQKHTAGYFCRAGRGNPEYFTEYSEIQFVWSADPHPAASLSVSPDREQHFTSESVTLNCGGNSTKWRVMTPRRINLLYSDIYFEEVNGFTTRMRAHSPSTAVYWCESESGEFSNAVNVTTHGGDLILVSPVHPVNEGDSVTLGCKLRSENFTSTVGFFKNDKLIQNAVRGELSIPAVSASDEGFYRCGHSGEVSPQSWVAVKSLSPSLPVSLIVGLVVGSLLTVLLVTLLLVTLRNRLSQCHRTNQTSGTAPTNKQDETPNQIYSSLLQGDSAIYESVRSPGNPVNDP
ncbi:Fc receptor-like protein 5 isoform X1 [Xiphophorus hellerii]|uniref:Fc receptor-like protein 5 isoform X1 n=1 Tax=Xiphophorus hellerii TaxID=8084 RepID=UPI0013B461C2|nr:Fc receptor-like protein 5 isoform X1 [Xiphophorus hellerii]XP_032438296.1 Fc receptor-like protein 5 isoform X1 [Xiphophorus hellerii]